MWPFRAPCIWDVGRSIIAKCYLKRRKSILSSISIGGKSYKFFLKLEQNIFEKRMITFFTSDIYTAWQPKCSEELIISIHLSALIDIPCSIYAEKLILQQLQMHKSMHTMSIFSNYFCVNLCHTVADILTPSVLELLVICFRSSFSGCVWGEGYTCKHQIMNENIECFAQNVLGDVMMLWYQQQTLIRYTDIRLDMHMVLQKQQSKFLE